MPVYFLSPLRPRSPDRLVIAPQDIRTADPTIANDIYAGFFSFAGKNVNTHGRSPFEVESPSPAWERALHGFSWLRHLRAADTPLARANGRVLVDDWISQVGRTSRGPAWEAAVVARRLLSFLAQSPLILEGADRGFYRRFMRTLGRHGACLQRQVAQGAAGEGRLFALIALAELGLCADGLERLRRRASRLLGDEIRRQILPDGGHIGRNPQTIIDLLLDLLPLRQTYVARAIAAPPELVTAIDRMMPMLRLFRHSDGELALFNGMGVTRPGTLAAVLACDDAQSQPLANAPYTGYQRIEAGPSVLVIDTGKPPPAAFSTQAHAAPLAFEFSSGLQRIIVNCGAPETLRADMREAARLTAAHSVLVIDDVSSCRFAPRSRLDRWLGGQIVSGPMRVELERRAGQDGTILIATHDGYERRFGLLHERSLVVSPDGLRVAGGDRLAPSGRRVPGAVSAEYAVRFHLHPAVEVAHEEGASEALLRVPGGDVWRFSVDDLPLEVEESIFFASPNGSRSTRQLVIHGRVKTHQGVTWRLEKVAQTETD